MTQESSSNHHCFYSNIDNDDDHDDCYTINNYVHGHNSGRYNVHCSVSDVLSILKMANSCCAPHTYDHY